MKSTRIGVVALSFAVSILTAAGCGGGGTSTADGSGEPAPQDSAAVVAETSVAVTTAGEPGVVAVVFDTPGADPRPIREYEVPIAARTNRLAMAIDKITYRGVICGFTFRGTAPASPVQVRMTGTKQDGTTFDSGLVDVSWSALDAGTVESGTASDGGWNFSGAANPNRGGPGWVVSLGGVTGEEADAVPQSARCELVSSSPLLPENGPVGYWAGFATN